MYRGQRDHAVIRGLKPRPGPVANTPAAAGHKARACLDANVGVKRVRQIPGEDNRLASGAGGLGNGEVLKRRLFAAVFVRMHGYSVLSPG